MKHFAPRLFSVLSWPRNIPPNSIIWSLIRTRSRADGFLQTANPCGGRKPDQSAHKPSSRVIFVDISLRAEICSYLVPRVFWSSVKEEFKNKWSSGSGTNCLILPPWCYLCLGRARSEPFDDRDRGISYVCLSVCLSRCLIHGVHTPLLVRQI